MRLLSSAPALLASIALVGCGSSAGTTSRPAPAADSPPASDDGGATGPGQGMDAGSAAPDAGTTTPSSCNGLRPQPLDADWTIQSGGMARVAHVHVPASYDPTRPIPVVLNFHGYTSDGTQQELLSNMIAKADAAGFVAVHPEGYHNSWNAGACCGDAASMKLDDVQFVRDLLDALEHDVCVDAKRVYATGMSNGGFLSHRLACELSDRIAAVAPVAGVLGISSCTPGRPVPVMHFHGTADMLVPYDGDPSLGFPSVPDTFAGWQQRDGCIGSPVQTFSQGDSQCHTYEQCAGGVEVTLCTVTGGGHTWPGGTPVPSLGWTTPYLSATDAMWAFFVAHPMP